MIKVLWISFFVFLLAIDGGAQTNVHDSSTLLKSSPIIAQGATLHLVSNQFIFTEGPAVDKYGNIYFTDQPNDKIWKYGTNGRLSLFLKKAGRSNGTYFDSKGNLITCAESIINYGVLLLIKK